MKARVIAKLVIGVLVIGGGLGFLMYQVIGSSQSYYYSVDEYAARSQDFSGVSLRLAGKVEAGSVKKDMRAVRLEFVVAGQSSQIAVEYDGAVPDNFAEGIEVVVQGKVDQAGVFQAESVMTKCESKYEAKVN